MSNYQIKLTPLTDYFFGGEKHVLNKTKLEAEYFVKSELYPQQTTLLGLLRYYLLSISDCLSPKKNGKDKEALNLIGEKSFEYGFIGEKNEKEQFFGTIKSISPLYLTKGDKKYIFMPFSNGYSLIKKYEAYFLDAYNAKEAYSPALVCLNNSKDTIQLFEDKDNPEKDFVFIESKTVGNKKGTDGITEDEGFYKQDMFKLNKDWKFAFDSEIDLEIEMVDRVQILPMGAEKRLFKFEIELKEQTDFTLQGFKVELPAIYCLSDCFVPELDFNKVDFAVNQNVSFRNLQSKITSSNYSRFSQKNKGYRRSNRYNLMKRGSILYFKDENSLNETAIQFKNQNSENIGFNKIQILKPNNL